MSFLGCAKMGDSRQSSSWNPAAVIPMEDEEEEVDEDGYATAREWFSSDAEDGEEQGCSRKFLQLQSYKTPTKSGSIAKALRVPALTEPIRLERKGSCQKKPGGGVGIVSTALELLKGFRPGSDVTRLQLPPHFNLPKSQLQVYGEAVYCCAQDYLGMCARGATPVERLLAVVRFHLSTTRPAPFLKAPYNPILGETHHVSAGTLNVFCEQVRLNFPILVERHCVAASVLEPLIKSSDMAKVQVSHHPPITALYATDDVKNVEMLWWHKPVPQFYGED
jgi:hypothetical protein